MSDKSSSDSARVPGPAPNDRPPDDLVDALDQHLDQDDDTPLDGTPLEDLPSDQPQQRRLSFPIAPHNADALALIDLQRDVVE